MTKHGPQLGMMQFKELIVEALLATPEGELAERLSTSVTTIRRWAAGQVAPSELGKRVIIKELESKSEN